MKIRGIQSGMVMQRGEDGCCDIFFTSDMPVKSVCCMGFSLTLTAERDRDGYRLRGIPSGGPYSLKIDDISYSDIYVGDVWILAGQSNMQGTGRLSECEYNCNSSVRAYYMDLHWDTANHPLHQLSLSPYPAHSRLCSGATENYTEKGVGPGLAFALRLNRLLCVPQGIICCAHGGTNLFEQWSPSKKDQKGESLYGAMLERFYDNGSNARGIFWYQGCSDANERGADRYTDNMVSLIENMRADMGDLPFVQVQISRNSWSDIHNLDSAHYWSSVREQQRVLDRRVSNMDTVHTICYTLSECIHLDSRSQLILGNDAAESMYCLINGKQKGCLPGIRLHSMQLVPDSFDNNMTHIVLTYDNVHGQLSAGTRAMGFDSSSSDHHGDYCGVHGAECDGNRVTLHMDFSRQNVCTRYLWYGFGIDPSCNICDSAGRSLPAFGPIRIENRIFTDVE